MKMFRFNIHKKYIVMLGVIVITISALVGCTLNESNEDTNFKSTNILDINIGSAQKEPVYECDAEQLANIQIDYTPFVDLKDKLDNQSFINECKESYSVWTEQTNTALYGSKGFYLSSTPVYAYHLNDERVAKVMSCYIFTEDKSVAGEIQFTLNGDKITATYSVAQTSSVDRIIRTMKESPDKKFIKIFNSMKKTIIDEDNKPLDSDFKMTGDVFHTLNYEFLGVSYNELVEDLVWVQFD